MKRIFLLFSLLFLLLPVEGQVIRASGAYNKVQAAGGGDVYDLLTDGDTWAWYISTDVASITKGAVDSIVSDWDDTLNSGNDLGVVQAWYGPKWYGPDGMVFDGDDDFMTTGVLVLNQPTTVYIVIKQISWTNGDYLFHGGTWGSLGCFTTSSSPIILTDFTTNNANCTVGSFHILTLEVDGASTTFEVDETGQDTGDAESNELDGFVVAGINTPQEIAVKEVIIREVIDNATDKALIYDYLSNKYGI